MILGVDLDSVCGDYVWAFRNVVARDKGVPASALPLETTWDFKEWGIESRQEFLDLHGIAVAQGIFRDMPPIEGVSEALWHLSDNDVWIRIVTQRLILKGEHGTIAGDTVQWLDSNNIPYRDLCFLADKPRVDADVYVDDAPHHIAALQGAGKEVIIFDQPYNQDIAGYRAETWAEVVDLLGY